MDRVDLHVHSTYSDGTDSPSELVEKALELNLKAFALTDHDTTAGYEDVMAAARNKDIEVVPGIELSTKYLTKDVHILGLYVNPYSRQFQEFVHESQLGREWRNEKMCENLRAEGIDITIEELTSMFPHAQLTRANFAKLILEKGYVKSMEEGFERYVGDHCKAYVPRDLITPERAIELVLAAGGVPVLAHPILYRFSDKVLEELVAKLKAAGLEGIETVYSTYAPSEERQVRALAKKYDLVMTGGSDYHGKHKKNIELATGKGKLFIPEEMLEDVKKCYLKDYAATDKAVMFFDMDGSLLNDEKIITPKTEEALNNAIARGNIFVISTGRPVVSTMKVVDKLNLHGRVKYISSFNGGMVFDCESQKEIYSTRLDTEVAKDIINVAKEAGLHFHSYSTDDVLCERQTEEVKFYSNFVGMPYKVVDDVLAISPNPYKILMMDLNDKSRLEAAQKIIEEKFSDKVQCVFSSSWFLEILPEESGKGNALVNLCKILGVDVKNSYAFADEQNDISMLKAAGHGVALLNARNTAKAAADYITFRDNNHDGLVEFIDGI